MEKTLPKHLTSREAARMLKAQGYTARLKDGSRVVLTDSDVDAIFDEAVRRLHNEPVDTICELHRLIFRKTTEGYDVFVMIGEIQ